MMMFCFASVLLIGLWVAAWLHWTFRGEIRQFLFAKVFPEKWRAGRDASELLLMGTEELEVFLALESAAPAFVNGVLGCPGCLSAHISAVGMPLVFGCWLLSVEALHFRDELAILFSTPLIWAGGAWLGQRFYVKF